MNLPAALRTRLEKAAVDSGFDRPLPADGEWLGFASTQVPLSIWLSSVEQPQKWLLAALSDVAVNHALDAKPLQHGIPLPPAKMSAPAGAVVVRVALDLAALNTLLRRAFHLSRALPDQPLHAFQKKTATMPQTTEAERLVVERVGQGFFRKGLDDFWQGRCAVTGLDVAELLRASHIKPWADCETDAERLDVWNGLLLSAHLDAAFDRGFITIADNGEVLVAPQLNDAQRALIGLDRPLRVERLMDGHRRYLPWHWAKVWKGYRPAG